MCGIAGYITKKDNQLTPEQQRQRQNIVTALMFAMEERGSHSTGLAVVRRGELYIKKEATPAHEFLYHKKVKKLLADNPTMVIGHTRWATTGAIADRNAHPFLIGNICGVHNGQVSNYSELGNDLEVDSQAIFTAINNHDGDFEKAFTELRGGMAVAWMDIRKPFAVNVVAHTNPLALCRVKSLDTIFFCSTKEAMQIVIHAGTGYDHNDIFEPNEDVVYTIDETLALTKTDVTFKTWAQSYEYGYKFGDDDENDWYKDMPKAGQTVRDYVEEELEATGCELCGRPYDNLLPKEKKIGILYDYEADMWICGGCIDNVGQNFDYEPMSWDELIDWKVEGYEAEMEAKEQDRLDDEEIAWNKEKAEEVDARLKEQAEEKIVPRSIILSGASEQKEKHFFCN